MLLVCDYTRETLKWCLTTVHSETETMGIEAAIALLSVEDDPLALTQGAEGAAFERSGLEVNLSTVIVPNNDSDTGSRVVGLDHALHMGAV